MTFKLYNSLRKHFRVTNTDELPTRNDPGYHPNENVNWALAYLRAKAQSLWTPGEVLCKYINLQIYKFLKFTRTVSKVAQGKMPSRRDSQINP